MQGAEDLRPNAARRPSNVADEKHLASRVLETSQGTEIIARARRRPSAVKWMKSALILGYYAAYSANSYRSFGTT
jgi:hypothetical protein